MPRYANYFATVREGKITSLSNAVPAHELLPNQVMLTEKEYELLRVVKSIEEAQALLNSVNYKIGQLDDTSIQSE